MRDLKYYSKFENDGEGNPIELPQGEEQEYPCISCIAKETEEGDYEYEVRYANKKNYRALPFGIYAHTSVQITLTWDQEVFGLNQHIEGAQQSVTYASTTIHRKIDNSDSWIATVPTLGASGAILKPDNYYTVIYLPKGSTLWLASTGLSKYKTVEVSPGMNIKIYGVVKIESTGPVSIFGNIKSLVKGTDFNNHTPQSVYSGTDSAFREIFSGLGKNLLSARHLILPEVSAPFQFKDTFSGCNMLSEPPTLPYSGNLSNEEYSGMFSGCSSLSYLNTNFTISELSGRDPCLNMMKGVGNSGIFRKNPDLSSEYVSGIVPNGWTIINNEE